MSDMQAIQCPRCGGDTKSLSGTTICVKCGWRDDE